MPAATAEVAHATIPSFLPDGKRYLHLARHRDGSSFLMLGESGRDPRLVMPIESNAQYVEPGVLVFARGGALVAQSFNASTGQLAGEPFAVAESVRFFLSTSTADFSTSPNGSLVFQSHADRSRLAWLDHSGRELGTVGSPGRYLDVSIEPAGNHGDARRYMRADAGPRMARHSLASSTDFGPIRGSLLDSEISPKASNRDTVRL